MRSFSNYIRGAASILDLGIPLTDEPVLPSGERPMLPDDLTAIRSDWRAVGDDLRNAAVAVLGEKKHK
jgi:hypothetical protein